MFKTILKFELRFWRRQPSVYIYAAMFFFFSMLLMHGASGGWDGASVTEMVEIVNSPIRIFSAINYFSQLIIFLIPAVFGMAIYRDFRDRVHAVLFSYPLRKVDYLAARFCAAFLVFLVIVVSLGCGVALGVRLPGVPAVSLTDFSAMAYLQVYGLFIIPNVLIFGAIVFSIVALTRNIYAGFATVLLFFLAQVLIVEMLGGAEDPFWAVVFEPSGKAAVRYLTRYWTLTEQNQRLLPIESILVFNRLLWLTIATLISGVTFQLFRLNESGGVVFRKKVIQSTVSAGIPGLPAQKTLAPVRFDFSFFRQAKNIWRLSGFNLHYILRSRLFPGIVVVGAAAIILQQVQLRPALGFEYRPMTWFMLSIPTFMFSGVINILTFLYAGMLVQRARIARQNELVDTTAVPNWVLLFARVLALAQMQFLLLTLILLSGVAVQAIKGHPEIELSHYLFELYVLNFSGHLIWAFVSIWVQTLFFNPYLGFFLLLVGSLGISGLPELGLKHQVFQFNLSPELRYSDLSGYDLYLRPFFLYKTYWMFAALLLLCTALLLWVRGLPDNFRNRILIARRRLTGRMLTIILLLTSVFLLSGWGLYYEDVLTARNLQPQERQSIRAKTPAMVAPFHNLAQPKIGGIRIQLDLFPAEQHFVAEGQYTLVNKSGRMIDTLLLNCDMASNAVYRLDRDFTIIKKDTLAIKADEWEIFSEFIALQLQKPLHAGDSLTLAFTLKNNPPSLSQTQSLVKCNGTFIKSSVFPAVGTGFPPAIQPGESRGLMHSIGSPDADRIAFEAVIGTAEDQTALTVGELQKEWLEDGRRFFHYRVSGKIPNSFAFHSAEFAVNRDDWRGVKLSIYHHPAHRYNLEYFMQGIKATLAYCSDNFGPYVFPELRWVEFPRSEGRYANAYPMMISCSEDAGFNAAVNKGAICTSVPFSMAAHEVAHHWWGYQVLPGDLPGGEMILESLPEYVHYMVMKKAAGKNAILPSLREAQKTYLRARVRDGEEKPLVNNDGQPYLRYQKGALAFYALSEYLGEENLNRALRLHLEKTRFQDAPFTNAAELIDIIRSQTPDSLQYLITDLFETITFYDNRISAADVMQNADSSFTLTIDLTISKYRSDGIGNKKFRDLPEDAADGHAASRGNGRQSLPLNDYIEVGVFSENRKKLLYLERKHVSSINSRLTVVLKEKPTEVVIDPYLLLIDRNLTDNQKKL